MVGSAKHKIHAGPLVQITSIASSITIIVGVATALLQLNSALRSATETLDALKMQALPEVTKLIDQGYEIARMQRAFLAKQESRRLIDIAHQSIHSGESGEDLYWSKDFTDFREITWYYERLGAMTRLRYVDINVIFEVVPFPDRFWNETHYLRQFIAGNWYGRNKVMPDFLENFTRLCRSYSKLRRGGAQLDCE